LGSALFVRHAQGLSLTEPAKSAMPALASAFDAMGAAVQELRAATPATRLSVAALPAIAQLWLAPRLPALRAAFPEARPFVHALEQPPDFRREPFDLGFFFVHEPVPGSQSFKLGEDRIFPACAPKLSAALRSPADLASHPLIWDTAWAGDWTRWLTAAGVADLAVKNGPAFSLYSLAVQAALDGAGILMAHESLVTACLESGALVAPFDIKVETGSRLELLAPKSSSAPAARLIHWFVTS
jgi:LysR family glycine cleavage system transcriptional activator